MARAGIGVHRLSATGWGGPPDLSRYGGGFTEQEHGHEHEHKGDDRGTTQNAPTTAAAIGRGDKAAAPLEASALEAAAGETPRSDAAAGPDVGVDDDGAGPAVIVDLPAAAGEGTGEGGGSGGSWGSGGELQAKTPGPLDPDAQFDILLGIDVVYEPELAKCLPKVIRQHLLARREGQQCHGVGVSPSNGGSRGTNGAVSNAGEPVVAEKPKPKDPGWLSKDPGEPSPCFYFVCPAREPSTVALFINSCVREGLWVRVTPVGVSKAAAAGSDFSYLAGPGRSQPPYPNPPSDACLLVRGWVP